MTRRIVWVVVVIVLIAGGIVLWGRMNRPMGVETVLPLRMDVVETVVASGQVRPGRQVDIGFDVAGTLESVVVAEGEWISAGALVATLRSDDAQRRVEQARLAAETARRELEQAQRGPAPEDLRRARAEVERFAAAARLAEAELARTRSLARSGAIPAAEEERGATAAETAKAAERSAREAEALLAAQPREEDVRVAQARLQEAEGNVRLAKADLARRTVSAPFAGIVARRLADPGLAVGPGTPVILLADLLRPEIRVETDEVNLSRLRPGQEARVYAPAYRGEPFAAVVARIGPEVDPQRGVVGLVLTAESVPGWLLLSMTVDATITVGRIPGAWTLPTAAVAEESGRAWVLVPEGRVAVRREVGILGRGDSRVAVEGISPDQPVLARAAQVAPGARIAPMAAAP